MTACIVGWSHGKFGKLDGETSESLIVKAASEAIAHAGIEPRDIDVIYVGNMNGGFVRQEFHSSLALQTHPDLRFKPQHARGERLRHRLGRDPHGPQHAGGQEGALRARGRRREDDRAQLRAGGRGADQGDATSPRKPPSRRASPASSARSPRPISSATATSPMRSPRSRSRRTRTAPRIRSRISRRNSPTTSAARRRTRTRSSRAP